MREETDADVIVREMDPVIHFEGHAEIHLWPYECQLARDSPKPRAITTVHSELAWVKIKEMR